MAKTAIITGVGAGLGASLVQKFAQEGYQVGMFARSTNFTQSLADELKQQNLTALPVSTDITNPEQVAQGFAQVREQLGPVDLLINHAGNAAWGKLGDLTSEGFEQSWIGWVLAVLGLIVGVLNVSDSDSQTFLLAAIALAVGANRLGAIPGAGEHLAGIVANLVLFVGGAVLVVAAKSLFASARD